LDADYPENGVLIPCCSHKTGSKARCARCGSPGLVWFNGKAIESSILVSGPGIAADDGIGCLVPGMPGRWGDYGAATGFFYVANENISGARTPQTNWGTFITQIKASPPLAAAQQ
jgi:hypothetical protein